jgi:hypothetical protein
VAQQDIHALHRARQRIVNHSTEVVSKIRGLLLDRGFTIAKCITRACPAIRELLSDLENELTTLARDAIAELYDLFRDLDRRIVSFIRRSIASSVKARTVCVSPRSGASARRPPGRSSPPSATGRSSRTGGIWQPG